MENKENFIFGQTCENNTNDCDKQDHYQTDIQNLQKVVLQSFKYCQAKKSKNKYIRLKKVQEMKAYQQKLLAIVKKKSEEVVTTIMDFSNNMISAQQMECKHVAMPQEEILNNMKQKIASLKNVQLKSQDVNVKKSQMMKQRIKRVTLQCEQELQKMESGEKGKKTEDEIQNLINVMQKPFKKLCSYFSFLTKEIKELQSKNVEVSSSTQ